MSMEELVDWADTSLSELNRYFQFWRSQRSPEVMTETLTTAQALYFLLEEVSFRRPGVEPSLTRRPQAIETRPPKPRVS